MRTWSTTSLKNLQGIHPDLRRVMDRALQEGPIDFRVIEGLRTLARQKQLVASGASQTMRSRHLTGHAVDIAPVVGTVRWDWPLIFKVAAAMKLAALDQKVSVEWGGTWKPLDQLQLPIVQASMHRSQADGPHFQLPWKAYP